MTAFDILLASFILLIAGISLAVRFMTGRRHRRLLKELTPVARSAGWSIDEAELGEPAIRLLGETPSGLKWEMIVAGRDREGRSLSRWNCQEIMLEEGDVIIGHVPQGVEVAEIEEDLTADEMRGEILWRKAEQRFGDEAPEGVEYVPTGSMFFREHFVVLASGQEDASLLLNPEIEETLLAWIRNDKREEPPLILFTGEGLTVATEPLEDVEAVRDVVKLGTMMVERLDS